MQNPFPRKRISDREIISRLKSNIAWKSISSSLYKDYDGAVNPREHEPVTSYGEEDSVDEEFLEKDYHQVGITGQDIHPSRSPPHLSAFRPRSYRLTPSVGGREATARLYRTQTSAEAWSKRQKVNRTRAKTIKVKLSKGNFVHEYLVP
ncbi:Chitin synthase 2 [Puccinia graminis f. sp. tritici]|uniref:Chitin synthase 2 n=1 Tax=Puccinia graminis f. sp. tritici TaxID=56615 RepID=A0A5B0LHK5_PUCGR|nr:Chitin synthase 2 [Puccinia graminis f. sp. tritici]